MHYFSRALLGSVLLLLSLAAQALDSNASTPASATLTYMNRTVMIFRSNLAGISPQQRADRAGRRLEEGENRHLLQTATTLPVTLGEQQGVGVFAGDILLFTVLPGDVNPEENRDAQALATEVQQRLNAAFTAHQLQKNPMELARALLHAGLAIILAVVMAWLVWRLRRWVTLRLQSVIAHRFARDASWVSYLAKVFESVVQIFIGVVFFAIGYLWLTYTFAQFPLTQPFADTLGQFLFDLVASIGRGFVAALPNLVTLVVIVFITRALTQSLHAIFNAVQEGRIELFGLHRETLGATRRIVVGAVWALGITFCYPYIPGSQSDVFKGLSVLFGFMFTLGSAGIVSQLMSGMTLIYSRALSRGDLVQIGETIGVVQEVGALSTKIMNSYHEEITIPNTVLVGNQIRNLSRLHESHGVWLSTKVTIGYDTPWRQVEAMLLNAVARVDALETDKACILQNALSDFYVEYEICALLRKPFERPLTLSHLHREIQDEFNTYGVQIMSPNFKAQPNQPVLVPKENWFQKPAQPQGKI